MRGGRQVAGDPAHLLGIAIVLAGATMTAVSRRVTRPLLQIQAAMLKLAGGDHSAEVSFGDRKDRMARSEPPRGRSSMIEADRLRAEQKAAESRAGEIRRQEMKRLTEGFQSAVGNIVGAVSGASCDRCKRI